MIGHYDERHGTPAPMNADGSIPDDAERQFPRSAGRIGFFRQLNQGVDSIQSAIAASTRDRDTHMASAVTARSSGLAHVPQEELSEAAMVIRQRAHAHDSRAQYHETERQQRLVQLLDASNIFALFARINYFDFQKFARTNAVAEALRQADQQAVATRRRAKVDDVKGRLGAALRWLTMADARQRSRLARQQGQPDQHNGAGVSLTDQSAGTAAVIAAGPNGDPTNGSRAIGVAEPPQVREVRPLAIDGTQRTVGVEIYRQGEDVRVGPAGAQVQAYGFFRDSQGEVHYVDARGWVIQEQDGVIRPATVEDLGLGAKAQDTVRRPGREDNGRVDSRPPRLR